MKETFKNFCRRNFIVFVFLLLFIITELVCVGSLGGPIILTKPVYPICFILFITSLLILINNRYVKIVLSSLVLLFQMMLNTILIFIYDSNGTYFEWNMLNQREDALATVEELSFRMDLVYAFSILFIFFIFISFFYVQFVYVKKTKGEKWSRLKKIVLPICLSISIVGLVTMPIVNGVLESKNSYVETILYGDGGSPYQKRGFVGNTLYEVLNGTVSDSLKHYPIDGLEKHIYDGGELDKSKYFGVSKGNNLIYILVETFEWYPFLSLVSDEQSLELFPNLNKFMNSSLVAENYYSREKTDTAEISALLGSNPTNKFLNYGFENNTYPWSLPNMFKESVKDSGNKPIVKSFHQNAGDFYNRNAVHESFGFDDYISLEDMYDYGLQSEDYLVGCEEDEKTLDSVTIDAMKDIMFPNVGENEQFMTFWITFGMHGNYNFRQSLEELGYYNKLDKLGLFPDSDTNKHQHELRTYIASVMDFDKALGIMMDKLEENGQLDNTTIVMFADHNSYYNNLSNYAKGIDERYNSELYRIPCMIYDQKLAFKYVNNEGTNKISKFTNSNDLLPTIFDILGIKGYKNLYLGCSMFLKGVESVVYSRAYGVFLTDKLMCWSVNGWLYKKDGFTKEDERYFIERAEVLLNKMEWLDRIYNNDYFKTHEYKKII